MRTRKMFFVFSMFFVFYGCRDREATPRLDFIVRVNRPVRPTYPDWVDKVVHPELELSGPIIYDLSIYDLSKVKIGLYDQNNIERADTQVIYDYLKYTNTLTSCLNLQDGLAIQQKGIIVFRKFFKDKVIFLWSSVVRDKNGDLFVPLLFAYDKDIILYWHYMGSATRQLDRFGHSKVILPYIREGRNGKVVEVWPPPN